MLRIGKLTDYATVILAMLAADRSRLLTASAVSEHTHIAAPTVAKLLKQMHRAGLVNSTRGTHGGYQLAREPDQISAAAILVLFSASLVLPDVLYYLFFDGFNLAFGSRHLVNPLRTLGNWDVVEHGSLLAVPHILGTIGLAAYATLIVMNHHAARRADQAA